MARTHPAVLATAIALPVALVVGVLVAAHLAQRSPALEPVALGPVPAPAATSQPCTALVAALPEDLDGLARAALADPAPPATVAWRPTDPGSDAGTDAAGGGTADPVVLRCGIERPTEFDQASPLVVVDGVSLLELAGAATGIPATTYVVVDRGVYVAVTLPDGTGSGPLQELADVVSATLPAQPLDPNPVR
ncbi:DUF3515 domain-containing protein [Rhodococcus aerolatus]